MILDQLLIKTQQSISKEKVPQKQQSESVKRSLLKTISWRMVGTIDTILIAWLITGTLRFALSIGVIELVTKMILYYLHERIWNHITYGK